MFTNTSFAKKIEIISIFYIIFLGIVTIVFAAMPFDQFVKKTKHILDYSFNTYEIFSLHIGYILILILSTTYFTQAILLKNEFNAEQFVKVLRGIRWLYDVFGISKKDLKKYAMCNPPIVHYRLYICLTSFGKYTYTLTRHTNNSWLHAFLLYGKLLFVIQIPSRQEILSQARILYRNNNRLICDEFRLHFSHIENYEIKNLEKIDEMIRKSKRNFETLSIPCTTPFTEHKIQDILQLLGYKSMSDSCFPEEIMSLSYTCDINKACPKITPQPVYCLLKTSQDTYTYEFFLLEMSLSDINEEVIQSHSCKMFRTQDFLSLRHQLLNHIGGAEQGKSKVVLLGFEEREVAFIRKFAKEGEEESGA